MKKKAVCVRLDLELAKRLELYRRITGLPDSVIVIAALEASWEGEAWLEYLPLSSRRRALAVEGLKNA